MPPRYEVQSGAAYNWGKGERMASQRHPEKNELIFVIDGRLHVQAESGLEIVAAPDDLLIYPRSVFHDEVADSRHPARVFWFAFTGPCGNQLRLSHDWHGRMTNLVSWLMDLRTDTDNQTRTKRNRILELLLLEFDVNAGIKHDHPLVARMRRWMTSHLDKHITIKEMAAECRMSKFYFIRLYKQLSGRTPKSDLRMLRIDKAIHLLTHTSLPAKRIAEATGFGDPCQFAKAFKAMTRHAPLQHRRNHLNQASGKAALANKGNVSRSG